jgi:hypothetical protein
MASHSLPIPQKPHKLTLCVDPGVIAKAETFCRATYGARNCPRKPERILERVLWKLLEQRPAAEVPAPATLWEAEPDPELLPVAQVREPAPGEGCHARSEWWNDQAVVYNNMAITGLGVLWELIEVGSEDAKEAVREAATIIMERACQIKRAKERPDETPRGRRGGECQ